jgi:hypothetical protein
VLPRVERYVVDTQAGGDTFHLKILDLKTNSGATP